MSYLNGETEGVINGQGIDYFCLYFFWELSLQDLMMDLPKSVSATGGQSKESLGN